MSRNVFAALALALIGVSGCAARLEPALSVHFTDVEGGAATLIITPAGESVLIDSGFPGPRDPGRILETARRAGLSRIDHYVTTHWHLDHFGGIGPLSEQIPIGTYWDRGFEPVGDWGSNPPIAETYKRISGGKSRVLKAGDELPLRQKEGTPPVSLRCIVANGKGEAAAATSGGAAGAAAPVVTTAVGAASCGHAAKEIRPTDNDLSLGFLLRFGDFEFLDLGDLTWNIEHTLVCPVNRIGAVDVYQVTHHGGDTSNNPALLAAVSPRVAVMNNGPKKGGAKSVHAALKAVPGMDVFQLHRNVATTAADNEPPERVANADEKCLGEPVSLLVAADGRRYAIQVGREGRQRPFDTR